MQERPFRQRFAVVLTVVWFGVGIGIGYGLVNLYVFLRGW